MKLGVVVLDGNGPVAVQVVDGIAVPIGPASAGGDPLLELISLGGLVDAKATDSETANHLLAKDEAWRLEDVAVQPPVRRPGKIMAIGLNYRDHVVETGMQEPESPLLFVKFSSSVTGHGMPVELPAGHENSIDFEAELCLVVGESCRDVEVDDALGYLVGYCAANDITDRAIQAEEPQWSRSKSFDTFCPIGPWIVTRDEIADPQDLTIRLEIDGAEMQSSSTSQMIFGCAELISWVSRAVTLEPGDLILTGTPPGVGMGRNPPRYLKTGETVTVEIEGFDPLENFIGDRVAGGK